MTHTDRLAQLNEAFKNAPTAGSFELPPDDDYQAVIDRFDIFEAKSNGHLYLRTEMSVATGPLTGWDMSVLHDLEDPDRFKWLKKHLDVLGVECESLDQLESRLSAVLDVPVLVSVKTKGEYRNVYVNSRLGDPLRPDIPAPEGFAGKFTNTSRPEPSDEVPF